MIRRSLDVVVALLGLAIAALPLMVAGILIRLESPGPALFRQVRIGQGGKEFRILKLRTMRIGQGGISITTAEDERITRVGRILRKTKFDELPQLVNVLKGDMSLVGPRPEVPEYAFLYEQQSKVWSVRPGITDPTSIRLIDESSLLAGQTDPESYYRFELLPRKIEGYLDYLERRSLLYDVRILFETVWRVLFSATRRGDVT